MLCFWRSGGRGAMCATIREGPGACAFCDSSHAQVLKFSPVHIGDTVGSGSQLG